MQNFPSFYDKPTSEIRALLNTLDNNKLDNLLEIRYNLGLDWSDKKHELRDLINKKKQDAVDAYKSNNMTLYNKINVELDELNKKKAIAQRYCEIYHMECTCIYIIFIERGFISPDYFGPNNNNNPFICDNFAVLDDFRIKNGFLPEPKQPVNGSNN